MVIEEIIKKGYIEEIVQNIGVPADLKYDLIQDTYLILLEYDQDKLQQMEDNSQLKFFITKIITNNWFSKTSAFFKTYKKPLINKLKTIEQLIEDEEKED